MNSYEEAIEWIHGRLRLGIKPGLARMEWMMKELGNPQKNIQAVHVGGTNGKGSTVTFLRSILSGAGKKTGTFTSPYFETFNERIAVDGKPITDEEWLMLAKKIKPLADRLEETELGGPTEFEVITAMMFLYFGEYRTVDAVLIEVGLGGRLDSTNIVEPLCSIITSIGLDHVAILGDSYEKIAFEKAGIIKRGVPVIVNVKNDEASAVIKKTAENQQSPIFESGIDFSVHVEKSDKVGEKFIYQDSLRLVPVQMDMTGEHQAENAGLAIFASHLLQKELAFVLTAQTLQTALEKAYWPGRTEILSQSPLIMMDGAHNKEGVEALLKTVKRKFSDRNIHYLFAAVGDKDLKSMIEQLEESAETISFDTFDMPRAASEEDLFKLSAHKKSSKKNSLEWIEEALECKSDDVYIITGSLYYLSSIAQEIKKQIRMKNIK
ncbi:bifunctional folylpolyglutamate synthase/dihydrofolate synthase [Jeotgalibacillus sp. ET6]|uniref:bifunctional folylpolyglutamate synthase/dihydrofolate synthase n=1 Tax=Jeotgalibacillus sp. ET6 TaxID=3037260 RepID=UPI002418A78F|nr:folylpolyglutamate synthase/dihydrofolate synthase family protein [Jeotgalibacillus sp. ET6]MDG5470971.1 bifunctional folylpolyglutamate synthase/dihydrofolate synthase [Jeotgalibacillus sp. ET6]